LPFSNKNPQRPRARRGSIPLQKPVNSIFLPPAVDFRSVRWGFSTNRGWTKFSSIANKSLVAFVHQNRAMRRWLKPVVAPSVCGFILSAFALQSTAFADAKSASRTASRTPVRTQHLLTPDDGMAVVSAALDAQSRFHSNRDCSHLVHAIYERAGFSYKYATTDDLYGGVEEFRRVFHPQTGDLIVWHGHVGIVVRPSRHVFFSLLSAGPRTDNYRSAYWIGRGEARFYRYVKN
jgi:hypothetical protein